MKESENIKFIKSLSEGEKGLLYKMRNLTAFAHRYPSSETKKWIEMIKEQNIKQNLELLSLKKDVKMNQSEFIELKATNKEEHKEILFALKSIEDKIDRKWNKIHKNCSAKWVEKAIIAFISIMVLASLYYIFDSVGLPH